MLHHLLPTNCSQWKRFCFQTTAHVSPPLLFPPTESPHSSLNDGQGVFHISRHARCFNLGLNTTFADESFPKLVAGQTKTNCPFYLKHSRITSSRSKTRYTLSTVLAPCFPCFFKLYITLHSVWAWLHCNAYLSKIYRDSQSVAYPFFGVSRVLETARVLTSWWSHITE